MILDENLFEDDGIKISADGRRRPTSYNKNGSNRKPLSVQVYDALSNFKFVLYPNRDSYGYWTRTKHPKKLEKAKRYLDSKNVDYKVTQKGETYIIDMTLPDDSEAADKYFKLSDRTMVTEGIDSKATLQSKLSYLSTYPRYKNQYTRPCKIYELDLTPQQENAFGEMLSGENDGLETFWRENIDLAHDIYQDGRMGGHLVYDEDAFILPEDVRLAESVDEAFDNYVFRNTGYLADEIEDTQEFDLYKDFIKDLNTDYETLKDFDSRTNQLIDILKQTLDNWSQHSEAELNDIDESVEGDKIAQDNIDSKNANFEKDKETDRKVKVELAKNGVVDEGFSLKQLDEFNMLCKKVGIDGLGDLKFFWEHEKVKDEDDLMRKLREWAAEADKFDEKGNLIVKESLEKFRKDLAESKKLKEDVNEFKPNTGLAAIVNNLIKDEWEAVQGYNDAIVTFESEGNSEATEVLRDILNEENVHVGQLETILKQLDASAEQIEDGKAEAEQQLGEVEPTAIEVDLIEAYDLDNIKHKLDQFTNQITIPVEKSSEVEDLLKSKDIIYEIDPHTTADGKNGKSRTYKLRYPKNN